MKKDTIAQFVCFITNADLNTFSPEWEEYAEKLMKNKKNAFLNQQLVETKNGYKYISKHEWPDEDFQFSFMNAHRYEHLPGQNVRVVQAGGYLPLQQVKRQAAQNGEIKIIAFVSHNVSSTDFYINLPLYHRLNIYQAYYESCTYGYVLEFFVLKKNAEALLKELKTKSGTEAGMYKECSLQMANA